MKTIAVALLLSLVLGCSSAAGPKPNAAPAVPGEAKLSAEQQLAIQEARGPALVDAAAADLAVQKAKASGDVLNGIVSAILAAIKCENCKAAWDERGKVHVLKPEAATTKPKEPEGKK